MFRRRAGDAGSLDRAALEANCRIVVSELAQDFDWRLADEAEFVRRLAGHTAGLLSTDPSAAADPSALRRLLEREASAEYFAALYDGLGKGEPARSFAITELFRPEEQEGPEGPRVVYRGYLYRASIYFLLRWTGRKGWNPPPQLVEDIACAAAEDVLMALLRSIDLREGRRAFWSYLSRAVERRTIDQLRALNRRQGTVSLDEIGQRLGRDVESIAPPAPDTDPMEGAAVTGDLTLQMDAARLSAEERFSLIAGAYGWNDTEAAQELARRLGRSVGPPDIRRWRFRGRDKLRRAGGLGEQ
jgi:DNA-directed RNA polymerase specialized sigma24 family protein